jgi:hypothetical protein
MEDQIPPSQPPIQFPTQPEITPEQLAELKERARQMAIQQTIAQQAAAPRPQPQVVYVRRNLTVAELIVVFVIACGIVTGVQAGWNFVSNFLPRLEIRVK